LNDRFEPVEQKEDRQMNPPKADEAFEYAKPDTARLPVVYEQLERLFWDLADALYACKITCSNSLEETKYFVAHTLKLPEEQFQELARYFSRCCANCDCEVLNTIARALDPETWEWVESQCYSDNYDRDDTED
jgi:hypothetical protein